MEELALSTEQKRPLLDAEIASIDNDITRGYLLSLLEPQDRTLIEQGGWGVEYLETYRKVLEDPQVASCYQQRFGKLTLCPIKVIPASQSPADIEAADWWRNQMPIAYSEKNATAINASKLPMDSITTKMLLGVHYGFSFAELMLTRGKDGLIYLDPKQGGIRVRRRDRIRFDKDRKPRLITLGNMIEGDPIHDSRSWVMTFGNDNDDDPYGRGLAQILYWLTLFKRGGMRHWLNFLDNFSRPSGKVEYPANASPDEKKKAKELAQALSEGRSISLAQGFVAELMETSRGTADFAGLEDRCDSWIAKVILSQSGTTDNGAWAGTAQTHENVADDIIASDGDIFSQSFFKNVVVPISFYNFPNANPPFIRYRTESEEDINSRIDRDKKLFELGVKPTPELIAEVYGEGYEYIANQTLLNGAQLQSLTAMITAASTGQMNPDSLLQIMVNTMGVTLEAATAIVAPIRNQPQPQILAPQDTTTPPQIPTQGQTQNNGTQTQNSTPNFSELRSGEIYDFVDSRKPDLVDDLTANFLPTLGNHLAKWQERIEIARQESTDFAEFQERIAGIFEGMEQSRQKLAKDFAQADRTAYLAGIAEAEEDQ